MNAAVSPATAMEAQPAIAGDGKVTVVPASLIEPLVAALPATEADDKTRDGRRRRGR